MRFSCRSPSQLANTCALAIAFAVGVLSLPARADVDGGDGGGAATLDASLVDSGVDAGQAPRDSGAPRDAGLTAADSGAPAESDAGEPLDGPTRYIDTGNDGACRIAVQSGSAGLAMCAAPLAIALLLVRRRRTNTRRR